MIVVTETELSPEHFAIEQAAHVLPWSEQVFRQCLGVGYTIRGLYVQRGRVAANDCTQMSAIGESGSLECTQMSSPEPQEWMLAGYYVAHTVMDEVTLMNIAVAPALQGQGFGAVLLNDLVGRGADLDGQLRARLFLEVRESNASAIRLYQRYGFTEIGRRPGYYPPAKNTSAKVNGSPETAIVMARLPEGA